MVAQWRAKEKLCSFLKVFVFALFPIFLGFDGAAPRVAAQETSPCVDPSGLARSVVSIVHYFDKHTSDVIGERATAWFYRSSRFLVTAAHFANELPADDWREVELRQARDGEPDMVVRTRIRVVAPQAPAKDRMTGAAARAGLAQDVAILELQDPFPNAQVLQVKPEPPPKDAAILVIGYPDGTMQAARGIVREAEDPAGKYAGLAMFEVQGSNRLLLNAGASGAPVLDCREGHVVAVLNGLLTGPPLSFLSRNLVIPTPWGSPTNTAVPASTLNGLL